jgi:hypothetical protein
VTKLLSQIVHGLRNDCAFEDEDGGQRDVESDQRPDEQLQRPTNPLAKQTILEQAAAKGKRGMELTFPHIPSFLYRCQVSFA